MTSPITYPVVIDDRDLLDDAALWAVIDSASAAASSSKSLKRYNPYTSPPPPNPTYKHTTPPLSANRFKAFIHAEVVVPPPSKLHSSSSARTSSVSTLCYTGGGLERESNIISNAMISHKVARSQSPAPTSPIPIVQRSSPSPTLCYGGGLETEHNESSTTPMMMMNHSLSGRFPSVAVFKEYQTAALEILEKSDYTLISGSPFIKKTGWRKISCYFNISYEIKDRTIEFDDDRNVQRAEFVVRAYMHGGRFSDGWGSCDRREKRFMKPNNDIPSTAETRAKNKACQDLLGIGGPGAKHA